MMDKMNCYQYYLCLIFSITMNSAPIFAIENDSGSPEPQLLTPRTNSNKGNAIKKEEKNLNPEQTEDTFYPDYRRESYQGKEQQLRLVYGIKNEQGFYEVTNIASSSYLVTIIHSDDSRYFHTVEKFSQTKRFFFNPSRHIKTWMYKEYTSPETLDEKKVGPFQFGWRTFETHKQFRIRNTDTALHTITFYSDKDGADSAITITLEPKRVSTWYDYKGGSLITNY